MAGSGAWWPSSAPRCSVSRTNISRMALGGGSPEAGPLLINMVHEIGNLRALCGEIVAVQAFASSATRNFPVEDTVSISLRFANGVLGSFMLSDTVAVPRSWEQTTQEDPIFAAYPDEDCYIVAGTDGSFAIPTMRLRFYGDPGQRSWRESLSRSETATIERADPLSRQLDNFCAVIRGTAEPVVTCARWTAECPSP